MDDDRIEAFDHGYRLTRDEIDSLQSGAEAAAETSLSLKELIAKTPSGFEELVRRLEEPAARPSESELSQRLWSQEPASLVYVLASTGDKRVEQTLCLLLDHQDEDVLQVAASLLARRGATAAVEPLFKHIRKLWAVDAIVEIAQVKKEKRNDVVNALLDSAESAINAHGQGDRDGAQSLSRLMHAFRRLRDPRSIHVLRKVLTLQNLDPEIHDRASEALDWTENSPFQEF
ncbi:MAG: hypothetical protein GY906_20695 [bacterium]|nr:hypothetical protein [bacterium]